MKQKCILVITDGIGHNQDREFNAFFHAKKPNYEKLFKEVPHTLIKTSGLAVGLPEGQMGNSEVGHMCIGSGRIIYQNLVRINKAIEDNTLKDNSNLQNLLKKCKKIHIIGLYSDGGVHSSHTHFKALLKICKEAGNEVCAHIISDGRDTNPKSGLNFIKDITNFCQEKDIQFASLCGRFYAMDRDKRWERTQKYYDCLLAKVLKNNDFVDYIKNSYEKNITDEFLEPTIDPKFNGIDEEDGLIFINFRNDRMKQIIEVLNDENFKEFKREKIFKNLLTMTIYDDKYNIPVLFKKEKIDNTLAEIISLAGLRQLHTAETEKYAHVTFFFNGGKEELLENETRVLIPSPKVKTYDLMPQMSAYEVLEVVLKGIKNQEDFIVVNFANGDMVGHTGDFEAAVKAVEAVDDCLGEIIKKAREHDYAFVITSDHGNCEAMQNNKGELLTNHTTFDVFAFIEAKNVTKLKENKGLSNIAASILKIMGLSIPEEMNEALF
ncbi:2,3-bisphosphoglycerate-independent phosphoglycerate mutase [Campylobacter sp. TTU-622]|uniref:2,3-bisphosphoglycerate-independent phosphoglycerate mutase n=1 Tax=unclassified Campylobacter TaxID=2593542 RepID=UPI0019086956|nr:MULTISPECIES: 2,3-bisphosphoglycerate-independent phosphoglycerate mutase [unclassified Campylobacter]MBK1971414.1 2,3-bisphosphoglycerate-independent phosphoglycerate mutase [Campylobacter sp. TTU_617]MBK1973144.1 2,3-bisphosphoglycerate-independent phosphoglycerate mutase [Campylobacter sp. TTU-622]